MTDELKAERELFRNKMIEAGYPDPTPSPFSSDQFLYQRDQDRFEGWQLDRTIHECIWTFEADEDGTYSTSCGNMFIFTDGTPSENDCKFCCYCGGSLVATHTEGGDGDE